MNVKEQIIAGLDELSPDELLRVQLYVQGLVNRKKLPKPASGKELLAHLDELALAPGEAEQMIAAIEEAFGKVNLDAWR